MFFDEQGKPDPDAGFSAVVGSPPWERIKLQENEFFALRAPSIALAPTAARRKALVAKLPETDPDLWAEYQQAKAQADLDLTREEAEYVMETFPIVKRHDHERFGRYRTKDLILHYCNAYTAGDLEAWV